jgi:HPt (histidine-containing phosphotransfer) domain-containing protein
MDSNIDRAALEVLLGDVGDAAFLRLTSIFIEECDRNCAEITRFLSQNDLPGTEVVAHRFKSTARQFGVYGLADICQELEKACATGRSEQAVALSEALTENMPQVHSNLNKAVVSVTGNG